MAAANTGNFTKVVQRVPVRIRFEPGQSPSLLSLRPGLSTTVTVRLDKPYGIADRGAARDPVPALAASTSIKP